MKEIEGKYKSKRDKEGAIQFWHCNKEKMPLASVSSYAVTQQHGFLQGDSFVVFVQKTLSCLLFKL